MLRRPLTKQEAAQVRAALPDNLKPLIDVLATVDHSCWTCEHMNKDGICTQNDRLVPVDKRKGSYDCWVYYLEPF